jgi:cell division protein FtsW (lipid II flippase)
MLEIVLAVVENIQILTFFTLGVIAAYVLVFFMAERWEDDCGWAPIKTAVKLAIPLALVLCIPDVGHLWKIRVGLLKLDLASPANVEKVGTHIDEVVKALECRHLNVNCPKEAK